MEEETQTRRVTIRLTPFQAKRLWKLRTADLPEGVRPRTVTEVLVRALLDAARALERDEVPARADLAVHDEHPAPRGDSAPAERLDGGDGISAIISGSEEARHP
jgi:hypothetical protein